METPQQHPTKQQLEEIILDLKEQLRYTDEDIIRDELIQEIKFRQQELENLTKQQT